jgi:UDP-N-acetyl-D-galactosamine dehydrogenase
VDPQAARHEYGQAVQTTLPAGRRYDAIVLAVAHATFASLPAGDLAGLAAPDAVVFDIKGMWRGAALPPGATYLTL